MSIVRRPKSLCLGLLVLAMAAAATAYRAYTTRPAHLLERGRAALERGSWNQAEHCLEALERHGYGDQAHLLAAEISLNKARLTPETTVGSGLPALPARSAFRHALHELAQITDEGALGLEGTVLGGECLVRLGERRFAAEALDTVVKRDPDNMKAHQWLAAIYMDLNSPSQAIVHLRAWGKLDPHNGRPYRWIGWFLSKDYGKYDEAIEAYREACRRDLDPALRSEVVKELVATLVDGPADYEAALDTLARSPELADQPEILALRAQCLWSLGRLAEANEALHRVLDINPQLSRALQLQAKIFLAEDKPKAALPLLEKALGRDAYDHLSRQLLMQAYRQAGDNTHAEQERQRLEEARSYKDRLTKLHDYAMSRPWDAKVRNDLADLCRKLNLQAEAQMWRQAALACTPSRPSETSFEQPVLLPERN
jgi:tetratricopeptide (TPR) repeat protein